MSVKSTTNIAKWGRFVQDNGKALSPMYGYSPIPNFHFILSSMSADIPSARA